MDPVLLFIYLFINSELNLYTSQEPRGEKTRKEVLVLEVGRKTQRFIPLKTHAVRQALKPNAWSASGGI